MLKGSGQNVIRDANRACRVMISGCSGGGKSTLLSELEQRGCTVVAEPGRRIIAEEREGKGNAFPWVDAAAFARRALSMSIDDYNGAQGVTFFDRGIVDAAVAIKATGGEPPADVIATCRYDQLFLAPPWPEIYVNDADRRHSLETALRDYERVRQAYIDAGYDPIILPRDIVTVRADFLLATVQG